MNSYLCSIKGWSESGQTFNAISPGQAKSEYWRMLDGDYSYLRIRCKKIGGMHTSEGFIRNAEYRQIHFAYCGMKVIFKDGSEGIIVGHNSSANLDIHITSGRNKGSTGNYHPHHEIAYLDKKGEIIKSFF